MIRIKILFDISLILIKKIFCDNKLVNDLRRNFLRVTSSKYINHFLKNDIAGLSWLIFVHVNKELIT